MKMFPLLLPLIISMVNYAGAEDPINNQDWLVSLAIQNDKEYDQLCSGSVIDVDDGDSETEYILTSGNCAIETSNMLRLGNEPFAAFSGEHFIPIVEAIPHKNCTGWMSDKLRLNDIGLIKIKVNDESMKRISLPKEGESMYNGDGSVATVETDTAVGDGKMQSRSAQPMPLDQFENALDAGHHEYVPSSSFNIPIELKPYIDRGSPYYTMNDDGHTLYGVFSATMFLQGTTGAVFTNVAFYLDWIKENAK